MLLHDRTGAWAGQLIQALASHSQRPQSIASLPVQPRKRCIFTVRTMTIIITMTRRQNGQKPTLLIASYTKNLNFTFILLSFYSYYHIHHQKNSASPSLLLSPPTQTGALPGGSVEECSPTNHPPSHRPIWSLLSTRRLFCLVYRKHCHNIMTNIDSNTISGQCVVFFNISLTVRKHTYPYLTLAHL